MHWLEVVSSFSYGEHDSLVNIASGLAASKDVNADQAVTIGTKAASVVIGKTCADVKLKRNDRVTSISGDKYKILILALKGGWIAQYCS